MLISIELSYGSVESGAAHSIEKVRRLAQTQADVQTFEISQQNLLVSTVYA